MHEILRQAVHLLFGIAAAAVILFLKRQIALYLFVLTLFAGFVILDVFSRGYSPPLLAPIMDELERRKTVPAKGGLAFVMSALVCFVFFPPDIAAVAVLALGVHDSASTLFGVRYGRTRVYNNKSLEGTAFGIIVTAALLLVFLTPVLAAVTAAVTGIVELLSPIDDNLIIPITVCLLLALLL
ncbi:MAG: phosphatidate cytidylyltransferase [Methanomicrobiaceae archaeon]|uniref:Phytol kinase n=1 Tax=hydrocarbon metagenome TaxID=938273 RepID=A0A0W8FI82_9ZZZZ|nr:phosphatidate cytidylyltransferase [Methanomicrobiaceae archaeon]MDD5418556.1 phosphatidate cytidylyltransferase [Methanomicrobiaceae archaeon]